MQFASRFSQLPIKRFYKYILRRFLGSFLKKDLDLDQLDVTFQLSKGILELRNLDLEVAAINRLLGDDSDFRLVDGCLGTRQERLFSSGLQKKVPNTTVITVIHGHTYAVAVAPVTIFLPCSTELGDTAVQFPFPGGTKIFVRNLSRLPQDGNPLGPPAHGAMQDIRRESAPFRRAHPATRQARR